LYRFECMADLHMHITMLSCEACVHSFLHVNAHASILDTKYVLYTCMWPCKHWLAHTFESPSCMQTWWHAVTSTSHVS
jgi:hypothetical protein